MVSIPLNFGYRHYADKYELFTKEVMCDNSDIPVPENKEQTK